MKIERIYGDTGEWLLEFLQKEIPNSKHKIKNAFLMVEYEELEDGTPLPVVQYTDWDSTINLTGVLFRAAMRINQTGLLMEDGIDYE